MRRSGAMRRAGSMHRAGAMRRDHGCTVIREARDDPDTEI